MSVPTVVLIMGIPLLWLVISGLLFSLLSPKDEESAARAEAFFARD